MLSSLHFFERQGGNVTDPVTAGTLVVNAFEFGATAFIKGTITEAAKDAYNALKVRLGTWASTDVAELEKNPGIKARQAVIAEIVDGLSGQDREGLRELAEALAARLRDQSSAIGLDFGRLEALGVELGNVTVHQGIGSRFADAKVHGIFKVGDLSIGPASGKT
jgi:hypothetical protein